MGLIGDILAVTLGHFSQVQVLIMHSNRLTRSILLNLSKLEQLQFLVDERNGLIFGVDGLILVEICAKIVLGAMAMETMMVCAVGGR